jgi:hypothetical protein
MINKLKDWFLENYFWLVYILFVLLLINMCSQNSKQIKINDKLTKQNLELVLQIDSIKKQIPNQEYLELIYDKKMYEFLKLSLYDNNAIVRQITRPDDRIRMYDDEIKKIEERLK